MLLRQGGDAEGVEGGNRDTEILCFNEGARRRNQRIETSLGSERTEWANYAGKFRGDRTATGTLNEIIFRGMLVNTGRKCLEADTLYDQLMGRGVFLKGLCWLL